MPEKCTPGDWNYVGDHVVGVVGDCNCPTKPPEGPPEGDFVAYPLTAHEAHDVVKPLFEDQLPEGVTMEEHMANCHLMSAEKGKAAAPSEPRAFQKDQSKFFRDVAPGDRHARLRAVGVAIRCETRAGAAEIADAMRWHAGRFSEPLDDEKWIERTAKSIERSF